MAAVAPPSSPVHLISIENKEQELTRAPPRKRQRVADDDDKVHNPQKKLFAEHPPLLEDLVSQFGFIAITIGDKRGR